MKKTTQSSSRSFLKKYFVVCVLSAATLYPSADLSAGGWFETTMDGVKTLGKFAWNHKKAIAVGTALFVGGRALTSLLSPMEMAVKAGSGFSLVPSALEQLTGSYTSQAVGTVASNLTQMNAYMSFLSPKGLVIGAAGAAAGIAATGIGLKHMWDKDKMKVNKLVVERDIARDKMNKVSIELNNRRVLEKKSVVASITTKTKEIATSIWDHKKAIAAGTLLVAGSIALSPFFSSLATMVEVGSVGLPSFSAINSAAVSGLTHAFSALTSVDSYISTIFNPVILGKEVSPLAWLGGTALVQKELKSLWDRDKVKAMDLQNDIDLIIRKTKDMEMALKSYKEKDLNNTIKNLNKNINDLTKELLVNKNQMKDYKDNITKILATIPTEGNKQQNNIFSSLMDKFPGARRSKSQSNKTTEDA